MQPPTSAQDYGGRVKTGDRVSSFAAEIVAVRKPFAVTDAGGATVGEVTPEAAINLLAGHEQWREARQ
jgi:glycine betaine/proline transport system ATP-binding protein